MKKTWIIWYRAKNGIYTRRFEVEAISRQTALQVFNKQKPLNRYEVQDMYEK